MPAEPPVEGRAFLAIGRVGLRARLVALSRGQAVLDGRDYVTPDDVKALAQISLEIRRDVEAHGFDEEVADVFTVDEGNRVRISDIGFFVPGDDLPATVDPAVLIVDDRPENLLALRALPCSGVIRYATRRVVTRSPRRASRCPPIPAVTSARHKRRAGVSNSQFLVACRPALRVYDLRCAIV